MLRPLHPQNPAVKISCRCCLLHCTAPPLPPPSLLLLPASLPLLIPTRLLLRVFAVPHQELTVATASSTRPCRRTCLMIPSAPLPHIAASAAVTISLSTLSTASADAAYIAPYCRRDPSGVDCCTHSVLKTPSSQSIDAVICSAALR